MIEIKEGQVYETTEVITEMQTAIVTTHKCAEHKIKLSFENGLLTVQYMDWQDNAVLFNGECVMYIKDTLAGTTKKVRLQLIDGIVTYVLDVPSEYQISASVVGADGDSLFVDLI